VTTENAEKTFKGTVTTTGSVADLKLFAETGGEGVAQDASGRVYVAAGQILVYSPEGKMLERIDVPERPIDLVFGGADRRTLFILTHHSLYAVRTAAAGI
jgi:sugar lactone lactonase YvrE